MTNKKDENLLRVCYLSIFYQITCFLMYLSVFISIANGQHNEFLFAKTRIKIIEEESKNINKPCYLLLYLSIFLSMYLLTQGLIYFRHEDSFKTNRIKIG